eukprot:658018-Prorocentrum_minimum.AAC.1
MAHQAGPEPGDHRRDHPREHLNGTLARPHPPNAAHQGWIPAPQRKRSGPHEHWPAPHGQAEDRKQQIPSSPQEKTR